MRPKIYRQLTLRAMVLGLEHFAKPRKAGFLERYRMEVSEVMKKRWAWSPVRDSWSQFNCTIVYSHLTNVRVVYSYLTIVRVFALSGRST